MLCMDTSTIRTLRAAALFAACGGCAAAAHAADPPLSLGRVYGYGDGTNIYGVQLVWAPPKQNEILERYDLGLRLTGQIARWVARRQRRASTIRSMTAASWPSSATG